MMPARSSAHRVALFARKTDREHAEQEGPNGENPEGDEHEHSVPVPIDEPPTRKRHGDGADVEDAEDDAGLTGLEVEILGDRCDWQADHGLIHVGEGADEQQGHDDEELLPDHLHDRHPSFLLTEQIEPGLHLSMATVGQGVLANAELRDGSSTAVVGKLELAILDRRNESRA
jgi:hypothetical protein